ncbi:MAG: hypothetical protein QN131_00355 [Armatimonadota bacterium]|nr:hypothetical protein [Armatimonadota bacterium]MDR7548376.1 hypothetical protein [Armatimonadota bacterium]
MIQKRVERRPGEVVVSGWIERNPWWQTRAEYEPTLGTTLDFGLPDLAGRPSRRVAHDGEGRPVRTVNYNGGISTVRYAPFEIVRFDANDTDGSAANRARGQFDTPRRETLDAMNRRTAVIERAGEGREVVTRYGLDPLGELLALEDGAGTVATYRYDRRGNRIEINHRDAGRRFLWYDATAQVVRTLDPAGHDISVERDATGRITRLLEGGAERERYTYDDVATGGWGRLSEVLYPGGRQRFTYNRRGQISRQEYHFDGEAAPQVLAFEFDGLGKQTAVVYPDGARVEYRYDLNGMVRRIEGFVDEIGCRRCDAVHPHRQARQRGVLHR